jgi:hypothetical protein
MIMEITLAVLAGLAVFTGAVAYRPLRRWGRKCRRRKGGVYLWRTRHHHNPLRRETAYVGESVNIYLRSRQHMGRGRFDADGQVITSKAQRSAPAQPWSDLDPVCHTVIKLPWWLCWKWVLRPLETLVILATWPRYNDAKNHWNPRRIPKSVAKLERAQRDGRGHVRTLTVRVVSWGRRLTMTAGGLVMLTGVAGWIISR